MISIKRTQAERDGADYIGFGPIFGTTTKATGYEARGLEMLKQIRARGQTSHRRNRRHQGRKREKVWQAGANSAAIISDILHSDGVAAKVRHILAAVMVRTLNGIAEIAESAHLLNPSEYPARRLYLTVPMHERIMFTSEGNDCNFGKP